jgi:tryptophan synthase alpha chain
VLESYIRDKRAQKDILIMTHIVLGYPSFDQAFTIVESMVNAGVDLIELQIPFSDPIADGPVILRANQTAIASGSTVDVCFDFAQKAAARFDVPFLFMSYYNILFKYGVDRFAATMNEIGIRGAIVPDLPPEEAEQYLHAMDKNRLAPIFIFSPNTPDERLKSIAACGKGFIYCVARTGVTGSRTDFSRQLDAYLTRCRAATALPLALGFGVKHKADVDFLKGKVDIAVIGTQTMRLVDEKGVPAVEDFIRSLS